MGDERAAREDPPAGLARRFLVGALYVGMGGWGTSALRIVLNLVLARILGPEIFGFYAFVFSINEILGIVGGFSMGLALIQSPRTSQVHEDTAFVLAGLLGLLGLLAALVAAPFLAAERTALAAWFLLLLAGGRILGLLGNVVLGKLERALEYRSVAAIHVTSGVLPSIVAVGLAWGGLGAWSLLAQDLLLSAIALWLAVALSGYRFRGAWDRHVASRLFAFGRGVFASRALEIALQRIDRLLVGAFLGDARLGLYHQGRVLAETGLVISRPLERLSLNLYARVQDSPARLERAFGLTDFFLVRAMFAGSAVLLVYPEITVRLLLGEAWLPAAPLLLGMALHAGLAPVLSNARQLLFGRGLVGKAVLIRAVQLAAFLPGLGAAIALGDVRIAALGLTLSTALGLALALWMNRDVTGPRLRRDFASPGVALAAALTLRLEPLREGLSVLPPVALPLLPALVFAGVLWALDRSHLSRNLRTLRDTLGDRSLEPQNARPRGPEDR